MKKQDMELQIAHLLLEDALLLKDMPKMWIPSEDDDNCIHKKALPRATQHFNWMGDGSDDKYDYCERVYDAWGVLYECDVYLALEDRLNELVQSYKDRYPNSKVEAEIDGCKGEFFLKVYFELDDKDYNTQLEKLGLVEKKDKIVKTKKVDGGIEMSERGRQIIEWLKEQPRQAYTAREISEGLFCSPRAVPGAMKKLVSDGLVEAEKIGSAPNQYRLTDAGIQLDLNDTV